MEDNVSSVVKIIFENVFGERKEIERERNGGPTIACGHVRIVYHRTHIAVTNLERAKEGFERLSTFKLTRKLFTFKVSHMFLSSNGHSETPFIVPFSVVYSILSLVADLKVSCLSSKVSVCYTYDSTSL